MGWITLISQALRLVLEVFKVWAERDARKRKKKEEALADAKSGIVKRDPSAVTRAFDKLNRV